MDAIPEAVAFQAVNPASAGLEPPPDSGAFRLLTSRYCLLVTPMPTVSFVELLDVDLDVLPGVVSEVRDQLRERGRVQSAWTVASTATDRLGVLTGLGMTPYTDPPLEAQYAAMATVEAPAGTVDPAINVRPAVELSDFIAVGDLAGAIFGMAQADLDGLVAALRRRYEMLQRGLMTVSTYLAFIDGELVGEAQAALTPTGTNLSGSSVLPAARGRGVYRALVAARWDEAVRRGLPALTVQAGSMSSPILEKLGFRTVSTQLVLCDRISP